MAQSSFDNGIYTRAFFTAS